MATSFQITVDCVDADAMSRFWSTALGYVTEPPPPGSDSWEDFLRANDIPIPPPGSISAIVDPDGVGPRLLFLRVSEPKSVKNRVHLDLRAGRDDAKQAKITELVAAGGGHGPARRRSSRLVDGHVRSRGQRVLCHLTR